MPSAREALLEAALSAAEERPWPAVRMVEVASAAGVSRQTLYNEFGGKDGLARALVRREAELYLRGLDGQLAGTGQPEPVERLVDVAEWTVAQAAGRPLLHALFTGCWSERLPAPRVGPGPPSPADLVALVRDRSVAVLDGGRTDRNLRQCELAVRLALAHLVAPGPQPLGSFVRTAVEAAISGRSPTTGDR